MADETTEVAIEVTEAQVLEVLHDVYDPEIPVNIVDLGLVYALEIIGSKVNVAMTLTAIGCPVAGEVMQDVQNHVMTVPGVTACNVELTFDPPWTTDKMTEDAKWELGMA